MKDLALEVWLPNLLIKKTLANCIATVTAYPPNIPSRDPSTWCRIMQHVQVLMVSDAPEFLHGLANLDNSIRSEASEQSCLKGIEGQIFNEILAQIVERRQVEIRDRLSNILAVRAGTCIGDDMSTLVGTCRLLSFPIDPN